MPGFVELSFHSSCITLCLQQNINLFVISGPAAIRAASRETTSTASPAGILKRKDVPSDGGPSQSKKKAATGNYSFMLVRSKTVQHLLKSEETK